MFITPSQAEVLLLDTMKAGLVPNLLGSPGVGKSDIVRKIAEKLNVKVIDFRLSQADPTELNGFPTLDKVNNRAHYAPPIAFPLEGDPIPDGYKGWLLFFDEINTAAQLIQAASYKILLDRMVGEHKLHPKLIMACAGNLSTDKAIVNRLSTAMQSRLIHFNLEVNLEDWLTWAYANGVDSRVITFVQFRPELLHKFDPSHSDHTFPCPRTWVFLSRMIRNWTEIGEDKTALLTGTIGEGAGLEFQGYLDIFGSLPTIGKIIQSPKTTEVSNRPDVLWAIGGLIVEHVDKDNIKPLMEYIDRMPAEFQVITIKNMLRKDRNLYDTKTLSEWIKNNSQALL